jgi:hypothetical protein
MIGCEMEKLNGVELQVSGTPVPVRFTWFKLELIVICAPVKGTRCVTTIARSDVVCRTGRKSVVPSGCVTGTIVRE